MLTRLKPTEIIESRSLAVHFATMPAISFNAGQISLYAGQISLYAGQISFNAGSHKTAKRAAAALDAFNAETRETVNVPELVH